jgi:hypothetical protein
MAKTATVEVLTAEVRVLMVGSRQITRSVYRQLDWHDPRDMEVFGRVNEGDSGDVEIIGKLRSDGSLVRGLIGRPYWSSEADSDDFTHWARHEDVPVRHSVVVWETESGEQFHWIYRGSASSKKFQSPSGGKCTSWSPAEDCDVQYLRESWRVDAQSDVEKFLIRRRAHELAKKLPLIILAGLR